MIKLSRKVLCLDWDARCLRMVVARLAGGEMRLEDAHAHRLPKTVDAENPEGLGEYIQQTLKRHHLRFRHAIVTIPRERAVINRLTLPPTPAHEVAAAIRFQAMKELPFPLDNAVIDYVVMDRDERGWVTEVLLAAVPTEALETVHATCTAAGLTAARVGLRPYANLVSCSRLPGMSQRRVMFVDVGPAMTEIDVFAEGQLAFARSATVSVPVPGDAATEDSRLTTLSDLTDLEASDAAHEGVVNELMVEITRTIQAYRASTPDAIISEIVIAGGTGVEAALLEAAGRRFELKATLFNPTGVLGVSPDDAAKLRSFAPGLGLAWSLGEDGTLPIDFINPKKPIPPRAALKRRLRIAGLAAAVVVIGALGTDITLYMRRAAELAKVQSANAELRKELKKYREVQNLVEEVDDWWYQSVWLDDLLNLTERAVEPGTQMLVQQIVFDYRTANLKVRKLTTSDWSVPYQFVTNLNAPGEDGERLYFAEQGTLRPYTRAGAKFDKIVDVDVDLLDLKKHLEGQEKREKDRKRMLKGL